MFHPRPFAFYVFHERGRRREGRIFSNEIHGAKKIALTIASSFPQLSISLITRELYSSFEFGIWGSSKTRAVIFLLAKNEGRHRRSRDKM